MACDVSPAAMFYQEEEVPFHPDLITSNLLHAFLVVRPTPGGYKMAVVTRSVLKCAHTFHAWFQGGCSRIWASNLRGQSSWCNQAPKVGKKCNNKNIYKPLAEGASWQN